MALVTIGNDLEIHLLNAFTRARVRLPGAGTFRVLYNAGADWYQFIDKAIVIRKPSKSTDEDIVVIAIYGPFKQLAFTKPGFSSWINVAESSHYRYMDVASVGGQIFALSASGTLLLVDIDLPELQERVETEAPKHHWACEGRYLVESGGDLLMVYQYLYIGHMNRPPIEPITFEVFKFDFCDRKWTRIKDLGNRALFVGDNVSLSVCAAKVSKCRGNSIYFVGSKVENWWRFDEFLVDRDCGVYDMAEGSVEPFYFGADYPSYYSCPIWFTPILV